MSVDLFYCRLLNSLSAPSMIPHRIVKTPTDDLCGSQLKLDIQLCLTWLEVDFHHISPCPLDVCNSTTANRMPFSGLCRNEFPSPYVCKVAVKHPIWIPYQSGPPIRRALPAKRSHPSSAPPCKSDRLISGRNTNSRHRPGSLLFQSYARFQSLRTIIIWNFHHS